MRESPRTFHAKGGNFLSSATLPPEEMHLSFLPSSAAVTTTSLQCAMGEVSKRGFEALYLGRQRSSVANSDPDGYVNFFLAKYARFTTVPNSTKFRMVKQ